MKILKTLFIFFFVFISATLSESDVIKFGSGVYEGEVKKGKAHGIGTYTFPDGTKYVGKFSKNKFHGKGTYTDKKGNVFDGKWKYGKIKKKINSNTREVIKLTTIAGAGKSKHFEVRGPGGLSNQWFEAELREATEEEIAASTLKQGIALDIFEVPMFIDPDYGDEKKLKELLNNKISKMNSENSNNNSSNSASSSASSITGTSLSVNMKYMLTEKGKRDKEKAETQQVTQSSKTTTSDTPTMAAKSSSSGGGGGGGGGSGC